MVAVTLEHVTGDLFDLALPALAHGCNCSGSMAGGIAVFFEALGAGVGGLNWPEVQSVLADAAADSRVTLVVVSRPRAGR